MPDPSIIQKALLALKRKVSPAKVPQQIETVPIQEYSKQTDTSPKDPLPTGPAEQLHPEVQRSEAEYQEALRNADAHRAAAEGQTRSWMGPWDYAEKAGTWAPQGSKSEEFAKNHPTIKAAVSHLAEGKSHTKPVGTVETATKGYDAVNRGIMAFKPVNPALSIPGALASAVAADERNRMKAAYAKRQEEEIRRLSTPPPQPIDMGEIDEPAPKPRVGVTKRD